ncbi:hypothetical protein GFH48_00555 [Streptomyces fagopyri]|uniref:Uncharacterized protein n=1 Tax=Streptomyces fagopyri TaxID=2662397 RepID=A0A5Q0L4F2_9ACTN|nr:hypothetical protein [Streptomyces fagopyri]QFZ71960.1 hypothetical protein GFH48_00555 [Streptomyces fagopyri]
MANDRPSTAKVHPEHRMTITSDICSIDRIHRHATTKASRHGGVTDDRTPLGICVSHSGISKGAEADNGEWGAGLLSADNKPAPLAAGNGSADSYGWEYKETDGDDSRAQAVTLIDVEWLGG